MQDKKKESLRTKTREGESDLLSLRGKAESWIRSSPSSGLPASISVNLTGKKLREQPLPLVGGKRVSLRTAVESWEYEVGHANTPVLGGDPPPEMEERFICRKE